MISRDPGDYDYQDVEAQGGEFWREGNDDEGFDPSISEDDGSPAMPPRSTQSCNHHKARRCSDDSPTCPDISSRPMPGFKHKGTAEAKRPNSRTPPEHSRPIRHNSDTPVIRRRPKATEVEIRRVASVESLSSRQESKLPVQSSTTPAMSVPAVNLCSARAAEPSRLQTVFEDQKIVCHPSPSVKASGSNASVMLKHGPDLTLHGGSGTKDRPLDHKGVQHIRSDSDTFPDEAKDSESHLLERVRSRLTGWSWEQETTRLQPDAYGRNSLSSDARPNHARSLSQSSDFDVPSPPPNTQGPSGRSSTQGSVSMTPTVEDADDDDEEEEDEDPVQEIELKAQSFSVDSTSRDVSPPPIRRTPSEPWDIPAPRCSDVQPSPLFSRQLSNLAAEERHFKSHRNSVELARERRLPLGTASRLNQSLMNSVDSFLITKSKWDSRHGPSAANLPHTATWDRSGGMGSISDASPPASSSNLSAFLAMNRSAAAGLAGPARAHVQTEDHMDYPISETDRTQISQKSTKERDMSR